MPTCTRTRRLRRRADARRSGRACARAGVELFALTDHDEIRGLAEARGHGARPRACVRRGVEISITWAATTRAHRRPRHRSRPTRRCSTGLARVRCGRMQRAREMAEASPRRASRRATRVRCSTWATSISSRARISRATWSSAASAATRAMCSGAILVGRQAGLRAARWAHADEAVGWIREAGGIAVLAHPGRYTLSETEAARAVHRRSARPEAPRSRWSPATTPPNSCGSSRGSRSSSDLEASRGSDFHGPGESENVELGARGGAACGVTPVWHRFS